MREKEERRKEKARSKIEEKESKTGAKRGGNWKKTTILEKLLKR